LNIVLLVSVLCYSIGIRAQVAGHQNTSVNLGAGFTGDVHVVAVQPDGKILVGGAMTAYKGVACGRLVRLNTDGTLDGTFQFPWQGALSGSFNPGSVHAISLLADGKILIAGGMEYHA